MTAFSLIMGVELLVLVEEFHEEEVFLGVQLVKLMLQL